MSKTPNPTMINQNNGKMDAQRRTLQKFTIVLHIKPSASSQTACEGTTTIASDPLSVTCRILKKLLALGHNIVDISKLLWNTVFRHTGLADVESSAESLSQHTNTAPADRNPSRSQTKSEKSEKLKTFRARIGDTLLANKFFAFTVDIIDSLFLPIYLKFCYDPTEASSHNSNIHTADFDLDSDSSWTSSVDSFSRTDGSTLVSASGLHKYSQNPEDTFPLTIKPFGDFAITIRKQYVVTSVDVTMEPSATSMAAHRPFAIHPVTVSITAQDDGQPKITVIQADKTVKQLHRDGMDEVKAKKPIATARKKPRKPKGPLAVYADKYFKFTNEVLEKIKSSDPLKPINMPIISVNTSHGNMKVFVHCQTTRLYNPQTGVYMGDLSKLFPAANGQLAEAMRERREQNGPRTEDAPEGVTYSSVLKPDEVLAGEE